MRGDLGALEVLRPPTLAEALSALAEADRPTPLAGGTDLYVSLNDGRQPSPRYLDLTRIDELRGIESTKAGIRLGARTTFTDLRRSRTLAAKIPVLAEMAATVGAVAIQNRGTLGGSLGNASPASDPAPVLLALDARVELSRRDGRRVARRLLPLSEFFVDYRKTAADPAELVSALEIPAASLTGWSYAYRKVGTRRAQAISKVVAAAGMRTSGKAVARIAFGSVAATSVRCAHAEQALSGTPLTAASARSAREALLHRDLKPIDDIRSTAAYRALVAGRLLEDLLGRIGDFVPALDD